MPDLQELVEYITKSLVDNPGEVEVRAVQGEKTTVYELRVGQGDLGKVIGKHGRTIRAIRTLLSASATKANVRAVLEILE
ncbi:MAG: KH domain-containing protein [Candidatus Eisenbacteria bacterium]|nr:KH domain-containing protein [Candidatus Eisenbacteria bacterium]MCC7142403.1 KH domain-containing protein [Candidatus Eisenbacteria bacterium]